MSARDDFFLGVVPGAFAFPVRTEDEAMLRTGLLQVRVSDTERATIKAVAERLDRDESSCVRVVFEKLAEEFGLQVSAPAQNDGQNKARKQHEAAA